MLAHAQAGSGAEFQLPPSGAGGGLFFEDFDTEPGAGVEPAPPPPPSFSEAELIAACDACRNDGVRQGQEQAQAEQAESVRRSLSAIAAAMQEAGQQAATMAEARAGEVARLLLTALAGVLPGLCARFGPAEVAAMARALHPALRHQPAACVLVHPQSLAALEQAMAPLEAELEACLRLQPSATVAPGDARIEWPQGAAVRDATALWREVTGILAPLDLLASVTATAPLTAPATPEAALVE